jgi:enoyl-CoA hydratase/carnithine racemase
VFSAGADLSVTRGYEPEEIIAHYRGTGDFAERVAALPQPTLSAITGYCIGGGLELVLATDFRIAEPTAQFRFPEVALGILPSWGGAVRTVRLLGVARAKELMILRERVDADEALRIGLVTELVAAGRSLERSLELAERLAALPPHAVTYTTRVIDVLPESSHAAGLELERATYGMLAQTGEAGGRLTSWDR